MYVRRSTTSGGVNGSKIDVIVLDDKAAPSEAASNAKRLMDDEQVLAVGQMSLSSTYAPMFQAATRTKTPVLLLGLARLPGERHHAADESATCSAAAARPIRTRPAIGRCRW